MINRIDHIVLTVRDINITLSFYTNILKMKVVNLPKNRKALQFGNQKINLHELNSTITPKAHQPTPGSVDLCFIINISIEDLLSHLKKHKIPIIEGPIIRDCVTHKLNSLYIKDPDKNLIELSIKLT